MMLQSGFMQFSRQKLLQIIEILLDCATYDNYFSGKGAFDSQSSDKLVETGVKTYDGRFWGPPLHPNFSSHLSLGFVA